MTKLEDLVAGAVVDGVDPAGPVTVVTAQWHGTQAVTLVYRDHDARVRRAAAVPLRRGHVHGRGGHAPAPWSFDADGHLFRLAAEARRIQLAHLFDPMLALTSSQVDPLPHQIQAVYGEMLPRQPLRFLLADDPGAGKTIMAGPLHQGADAPRRPRALPDRRARAASSRSGRTSCCDKFGLRFEIVDPGPARLDRTPVTCSPNATG